MASELRLLTIDAHDPELLSRFWGGVLGREVVPAVSGGRSLVPNVENEFRIHFQPSEEPKRGPNQMHFDLTSAYPEQQDETVARALELGARQLDVGQRPEEGHVVLADPEGNEFCVLPAGNRFTEGCGTIGTLSSDGTHAVGVFWSAALGWLLVWDQDEETAIQSPRGGSKIAWGGPPVAPKLGKGRSTSTWSRRTEPTSRARSPGSPGSGRAASTSGRGTCPGSFWPTPTATSSASSRRPSRVERPRHADGRVEGSACRGHSTSSGAGRRRVGRGHDTEDRVELVRGARAEEHDEARREAGPGPRVRGAPAVATRSAACVEGRARCREPSYAGWRWANSRASGTRKAVVRPGPAGEQERPRARYRDEGVGAGDSGQGADPLEEPSWSSTGAVCDQLLLGDAPEHLGPRSLAVRGACRRETVGQATPRVRPTGAAGVACRWKRGARRSSREPVEGGRGDAVPSGLATFARWGRRTRREVGPGPVEQLAGDDVVGLALGDEDRQVGEPAGSVGTPASKGRVP